MNHTGVSLREHLDKLESTNTINSMRSITFESTGDFSPHNESYMGDLPMMFSFEPYFSKVTGWVELKDGFFSLLPLLLSQKELLDKQLVLPDVARYFSSALDFYYSRFSYHSDSKAQKTQCYVWLDYYQGLSSQDAISKNLSQLNELCRNYEQVNLVLSVSGIARKEASQLFDLINSLRSLPEHCKIIGNEQLLDIKNFKGAPVYLMTDHDFVLKSPWENIFISRGARLHSPLLDAKDEIVLTVPVSPGVDKIVLRHKNTSYKLTQEQREHFSSYLSLFKNSKDMLRASSLRQIRDLVKLIQR